MDNKPKRIFSFTLNSLGTRMLLSFGAIIISVLVLVWINEQQIRHLIHQENMLLNVFKSSQSFSSILYNAVNRTNTIIHEQLIYENLENRQLRKKIWE